MEGAFPGLGTVINVATVVIGSLLGMAVGHRLPDRTRSVVTDCLGLTTLLMAGLSAAKVTDASLASAVGSGVPVLIVLGSLLIGGISGSLMRIEGRLESFAGAVQADLRAARNWSAPRRPVRGTRPANASSRAGSAPHFCSASDR